MVEPHLCLVDNIIHVLMGANNLADKLNAFSSLFPENTDFPQLFLNLVKCTDGSHRTKENIVDLLKAVNLTSIACTNSNWINLFFNKLYHEILKLCTKHNLDLNVGGYLFNPFVTETEKEFVLKNEEADFYNNIRKTILTTNVISIPEFIMIINTHTLKLEEIFKSEARANININYSVTPDGENYHVSGLVIHKKDCFNKDLISLLISEEIEIHSPFIKKSKITRASKLIERYGDYLVAYIFLSNTPIQREIYEIVDKMDTELDIKVMCSNMKGEAMFETVSIDSISIVDAKNKISLALHDFKSKPEVMYYHTGTSYQIKGRNDTVGFPSYLYNCLEPEIILTVILKVETFAYENKSENEFDVCIFSKKSMFRRPYQKAITLSVVYQEMTLFSNVDEKLFVLIGPHFIEIPANDQTLEQLKSKIGNLFPFADLCLFSLSAKNHVEIKRSFQIPVYLTGNLIKEIMKYSIPTIEYDLKAHNIMDYTKEVLCNENIILYKIDESGILETAGPEESILSLIDLTLVLVEMNAQDPILIRTKHDIDLFFFVEYSIDINIRSVIIEKLGIEGNIIHATKINDHEFEYELMEFPSCGSDYSKLVFRKKMDHHMEEEYYTHSPSFDTYGEFNELSSFTINEIPTIFDNAQKWTPRLRLVEEPAIDIPAEINGDQEAEIVPLADEILMFGSQEEAIDDFIIRFGSSFHASFFSLKGKKSITNLISQYPAISNVQFSKILHVTEGTIRYWKNTIGKKANILIGRPKSMSDADEVLFETKCKELREKFLPVKIKTGLNIITEMKIPSRKNPGFWIPSIATVQRLFKRIGWTSRVVQPRSPMSEPPNKEVIIQTFLDELRDLLRETPINDSNFWIMDESAIYSNAVTQYTYCPKEDKGAYVLTGQEKRRDTIAVTLNADGRGNLFFIEHKKSKVTYSKDQRGVIERPSISGMSTNILIKWALNFVTYAKKGDILLWDNLASHNDSIVLGILKNSGIKVKFLPIRCADRLSVLDFSWFSIFKRELSNYVFNSLEDKKRIVQSVFVNLLGSKVKCFFENIGYYKMIDTSNL